MPVRFIHVTNGPDEGVTYALPDDEPQLIGRSTEALPITDRQVSRRHAELTPDRGTWYLRDLQSTNGTRLNGTPVRERVALAPGDRIECGATVLMFDGPPIAGAPVRAVERDEESLVITGRHAERTQGVGQNARHGQAESQVEVLLHANELAVSTLELGAYLNEFMTLLLDAFEAEHVAVITYGPSTTSASSIVVRTRPGIEDRALGLSRELIRQSRTSEDTLIGHETRETPDGTERSHWVAASPLRASGRVIGVAYLDVSRDISEDQLHPIDIDLLHALTSQAGMAIERGQLVEELLAKGRLATMGQTVAAISHGVKNILQGLRGGADAVQMGINREDLELAARGWPIVSRNLDRIQNLTLNMLGFARQRSLEFELMSVSSVVREAMEMMESAADRKRVRLEFEDDPGAPPILIDPAAILQILINLISNAVDASDSGSPVRIRLTCPGPADRIVITVRDRGAGVDPVIHERLFEPFVTSKGQRGTGLGLVVSLRLAESHGGSLGCERTGPEGTTMELTLPTDRGVGDSEDTHGPRGISEADLDIEFGAAEH